MKKEEIELHSVPFILITKQGRIYTVKTIRVLNKLTITFYDKFGGLNSVDLVDISNIEDINQNHSEKEVTKK